MVKVLALQEGEYNNKPTYKLTIQQDVEAGTISCTKEVFNGVEPGKDYVLEKLDNDQYKSTQFTAIIRDLSAVPQQQPNMAQQEQKQPDKK